jgi:hypothetical protein
VGADLLQTPDEDAEAGGVEELDRLEVDDQVIAAAVDQRDQTLTEPGGGVDVDLATDGDQGSVPDHAGVNRQIHTDSS